MLLIFLSKVQIGNQEVEIALSTSLNYNLAGGRNNLAFCQLEIFCISSICSCSELHMFDNLLKSSFQLGLHEGFVSK